MSSHMPSIVVSCHYGQNVWGALEHYFLTRKMERPDVPHNGFGDLFPSLILFVFFLNWTRPAERQVGDDEKAPGMNLAMVG